LRTTLALGMLIVSGCNFTPVGPKYLTPDIPPPPAFKEAPPPGDGWKFSQPRDDAHRGKWWEIYNDLQLNALEEQVLVNNQTIQAAAANYRSARAGIQAARSALFPTVTGGGTLTGSQASSNRFGGTFGQGIPFADIVPSGSAAWEADVWGRIRNTIASNVAGTQASAADLENALLSARAAVAAYYFELEGLDAQKQLLDSTTVAYARALELTTNRYNEGIVSAVDVVEAQTQLETARAQSTDTEVLRAQYEHAIAVLLGKAPSEFSIPVTQLASQAVAQPPPTPEGLPSELLERRPDIAAAERRVAAANDQIGVARAAFYPTVTLAAQFGLESSSLLNLLTWPSRFWSVGPTLAQTLWEGGRRRAATEQAQAAYDASAANYRETVLSAFQEVEDDVSALRLLDLESGEQSRAVTAAERSLALATNRYQGGLTTYLEVITAQSIALTDERTAVEVNTRRMTASVDLVKALGGGWNTATDLPSAETLRSAK
jgi:NodT family efflux transporter outer membrane factor (OMF) lipoprotein